MNLFRIILLFFAVYLIRRAFQFYKFIKQQQQQLQELQQKNETASTPSEEKAIDAEFKVID